MAPTVRAWPALGAEALPPSPAHISPDHMLLREHSVHTGRLLRETAPQDLPSLLFPTLCLHPDKPSGWTFLSSLQRGLIWPLGSSRGVLLQGPRSRTQLCSDDAVNQVRQPTTHCHLSPVTTHGHQEWWVELEVAPDIEGCLNVD